MINRYAYWLLVAVEAALVGLVVLGNFPDWIAAGALLVANAFLLPWIWATRHARRGR